MTLMTDVNPLVAISYSGLDCVTCVWVMVSYTAITVERGTMFLCVCERDIAIVSEHELIISATKSTMPHFS